MLIQSPFAGVYAAAVTPLLNDDTLDLDSVPHLVDFFAGRGCHGSLFFGTTGEGPSFSLRERQELWRVAAEAARSHPGFRLLAGTGTPSLDETIQLTRAAFEAGADGVIVLPPYYFRKVSEDGLFAWFSEVIRRAVPDEGALFGYHIPSVSGVGFSLDLLKRLKDAFPRQFAGLKDSSASPEFASQLGEQFKEDLVILNGTDRLFSRALAAGASGCITAMANLVSPDLRKVWDAFVEGKQDEEAQKRLNQAREVFEKYPPAAPLLKGLLSRFYHFPQWSVRLPLLPTPDSILDQAASELPVLENVL